MKFITGITALTAGLAVLGCSLNALLDTNQGPGSETVALVGGVVYPGGTKVLQAKVIVRRTDYVAPIPGGLSKQSVFKTETTTDSIGHFLVDSLDTGDYCIEVNDGKSNAVVLHHSVRVRTGLFNLPVDTLRPTGSIAGVINPQSQNLSPLYVQVFGLERIARRDTVTGVFIVDDVPAGNFRTRIVSIDSTSIPEKIDTITVRTGHQADMGTIHLNLLSGWNYSLELNLNTTATGANIPGNVYKFPLLVRLTTGNFNFGQAQTDGSDVRFAKSDNTLLPYEIERWDAALCQAEIWVTVDTVYGNDSTHGITMFWGNSSATNASNGAAAFDTTNGFRGVWHLADNGANPTVKDATGKNDGVMKSGTAEINTSSTYIDGIDGGAVDCLGHAGLRWIDLGANKAFINSKSEVSISVWMNAVADSFASKKLINFSRGGTLTSTLPESRASVAINYNKIILEVRAKDTIGISRVTGTKTFVPKQWYHIVGLMKVPQDSIYLYVNGELWGSASAAFNATATDPTNSTNSAIGANDLGKDDYFYGKIDEARLEDKARSPDWIKLSYMNQKEVDALVK